MIEQQPPLQVIRGFPLASGAILTRLHNISGGVLSGDRLHLNVRVGPQAQAQLTSTGATRVYRQHAERDTATQFSDIQVAEGALLEYVPDPLIPFAGSRDRQVVHI